MMNRQACSRRQAGTSVLAALVFVAIFVLFISGYKIASQSAGSQSAAVASARTYPTDCRAGEVYTVNMSSGEGRVQSRRCQGSDSASPECVDATAGKCVIRYCPPSSYVTDEGTCFLMAACDPGSGSGACLRSTIQNATQPLQAANIIAAQLLNDKGVTDASAPGTSGALALAEKLSENGRSAVGSVIDETADAATQNNFDATVIRDIARDIKSSGPVRPPSSGPVAQLSCQPKIAQSGMKIAVAFGCANSVMSSSNEFNTSGRLWGATEVQLEPSLPNGTMTYGLNCSDGVRQVSASCSVTVSKPLMLLTSESSAEGTSFAWVTRGMDVCQLNAVNRPEISAQFANPLPQSGSLGIPAVQSDVDVMLTCTSVSGEIREIRTSVQATL